MNDRNITNARFIQVNQWPQIDSHSTPKLYVDNSFNDPSIIKNTDNVDLIKENLDNVRWVNVNKMSPPLGEHLIPIIYLERVSYDIRSNIDNLHEINRKRRDLTTVFNDQDNEFENNILTNLDSITVKRNPTLDNELSNKKYIDDELNKNTIVRFNQTLENYLKVSVGNDTYNLTKYNKIQ